MNFKIQASPHLRTPNADVSKMMLNVVIALVPVVAVAIFYFRLNYIFALSTSVVSICGFEYIANKLMKKESTLKDYSALVTAMIFSLTLPIGMYDKSIYGDQSTAYIVGTIIIAVSGAFAIIVGKMIFGGLGRNIFNPAGLGRIFLLISFGSLVTFFSKDIVYLSSATPLQMIKESISEGSVVNISEQYNLFDLFVGRKPGAFGEISSLAIIFGALYLMIYKIADWRIIITALASFAFFNLIYVLRTPELSTDFILVQLLTGGVLFGVVFMATDPVTSPVTAPGRVLYAILIAGITFTIRMFGAYPEGMLFAILIMNMFAPAIDYYKWASVRYTLKWIITIIIATLIFIAIALIGTM